MKPCIAIAAGLLVLGGCATSSSVRQQVDPLEERLARTEARMRLIEEMLADMDRKADAQLADLRALRGELQQSTAASERARKAADDANAAAARAAPAADTAANGTTRTTQATEPQQRR